MWCYGLQRERADPVCAGRHHCGVRAGTVGVLSVACGQPRKGNRSAAGNHTQDHFGGGRLYGSTSSGHSGGRYLPEQEPGYRPAVAAPIGRRIPDL